MFLFLLLFFMPLFAAGGKEEKVVPRCSCLPWLTSSSVAPEEKKIDASGDLFTGGMIAIKFPKKYARGEIVIDNVNHYIHDNPLLDERDKSARFALASMGDYMHFMVPPSLLSKTREALLHSVVLEDLYSEYEKNVKTKRKDLPTFKDYIALMERINKAGVPVSKVGQERFAHAVSLLDARKESDIFFEREKIHPISVKMIKEKIDKILFLSS